MGSVGDCYDNAVCETFHASLTKERIYRCSWPTRAEARVAVRGYIEGWYNPRRRHSTLGYLSPAEFGRHHAERAALPSAARIGQRISPVDFVIAGSPAPKNPPFVPTGSRSGRGEGSQGTNGRQCLSAVKEQAR